ncbi:hypothetical protein V2G26_012166 [Clonostachys chloroleuca]
MSALSEEIPYTPANLADFKGLIAKAKELAGSNSQVGAYRFDCRHLSTTTSNPFPESSYRGFDKDNHHELVYKAMKGRQVDHNLVYLAQDRKKRWQYQQPSTGSIDLTESARDLLEAEFKPIRSERCSKNRRYQLRLSFMAGISDLPEDEAVRGHIQNGNIDPSVGGVHGWISIDRCFFQPTQGIKDLGWIILQIAGYSGIYVVIQPQDTKLFEDKFEEASRAERCCTQWVMHQRAVPSLKFLDEHHIHYSLCRLKVGDALVVLPRVYQFGLDPEGGYSQYIAFAPPGWDPEKINFSNCEEDLSPDSPENSPIDTDSRSSDMANEGHVTGNEIVDNSSDEIADLTPAIDGISTHVATDGLRDDSEGNHEDHPDPNPILDGFNQHNVWKEAIVKCYKLYGDDSQKAWAEVMEYAWDRMNKQSIVS